MPRFRYAGQDPVPDGEGGVVRPGEEREFDAEPGYGPWDEIQDEPADGPQPPADVPPAPAPAKGAVSKTEPASDDSATE